jgi:AraC family transcriptional regulator of adaptative response/methylated-DNA-[protein]-cysteine methyltransferase
VRLSHFGRKIRELEGRLMRIRYAVTESPLGFVLVAATERGLCRVAVARSRAALHDELGRAFPRATLERAGADFEPHVTHVLQSIRSSGAALSMPLDVRATPFQRRVWGALREIPRGETRSYSEIARSIGKPNAARAVGGACAKNPMALLIPCHRAVREDGELAGYAWGVDVKRRLLDLERSGLSKTRAGSVE